MAGVMRIRFAGRDLDFPRSAIFRRSTPAIWDPDLFLAFTVLSSGPALADPGLLTVAGQATVSAAPDAVTINAGVTSSGKTAKEALDANSRAMSAVFAALKTLGIPDGNIRTTNLNLSPQYASIPPGSIGLLGDRPVVGYRAASATISASSSRIPARPATALDALGTQAGANRGERRPVHSAQ